MSEVTIIFSDDDKKNLEKYMEATHGGKWNIHDDFDIMDIMQVVLNDIDKKVNSKQKECEEYCKLAQIYGIVNR